MLRIESTKLTILGDIEEGMRTNVLRWPGVSLFGPRLAGLLHHDDEAIRQALPRQPVLRISTAKLDNGHIDPLLQPLQDLVEASSSVAGLFCHEIFVGPNSLLRVELFDAGADVAVVDAYLGEQEMLFEWETRVFADPRVASGRHVAGLADYSD